MSYADDKVKQWLVQQSRERNSKINDLICPVVKLVQDFILVHLICRFQEDPIKAERVTQCQKEAFFSNQGDVTP